MNWMIFALMFPHLKPKCLDILCPELYRGLDVLRIISLLVLIALFIRRFIREKRLPSPVSWVIAALEGWICLNTLLKGGDYVEVFSIAVSAVAIVLLVDHFADRMKECLTSLMLNFEWMVYANLVTVLMYPNVGIVQDPDYADLPIYFFHADNGFMYLCIPAVCVALLYLRIQVAQQRKVDGILRSVYLILASCACVYLRWPATAVVAMLVLLSIMMVALIPGVRRAVIFPVILAGGIVANLALVVFRVAETVTPITDFVLKRLKKNVTFSGRTRVWDAFLEQLKGHVWTGIGNPENGYLFGEKYLDHVHNQYYDMLALGGIIALVLFLAVLLLAGWKLTVHRKTWSARIMTAVMAGLLVMCIPEVCRMGSIFLLFPLAYHVDKVEEACLEPTLATECSQT